jgi:hypothetical protein
LKEPDAPKLNSSSKKRLVVQSRCGGLDYLSPLGVLMALMPYTNYQKTTQTTIQQNRNKAEETLAANWAYGCDKFEGLNPEGCQGCPS